MLVCFTKMNSFGNDYILIDALEDKTLFNLVIKNVIKLSDRRYGLGSDGILIIEPSEIADFRMTIFNADGTRALMCGNGLVQSVKYFCDVLGFRKDQFSVETDSGIITVVIQTNSLGNTESISLNFGILKKDVSALWNLPENLEVLSHFPVSFMFKDLLFYLVQIGPLHAISFVSEDLDSFDFCSVASNLEKDTPFFPDGVNIEFVNILSNSEIKVLFWERGVGHSFACGTGATASAALALSLKKVFADRILVHQEQGVVAVSKEGDNFILHGHADVVFQGAIELY